MNPKRALHLLQMQYRTKSLGDVLPLVKAYRSVSSVEEEVHEDFERLRVASEKYGLRSPTASAMRPDGFDFWRRYSRVRETLERELFRIYKLRLDVRSPLSILDIGAAAGVFVYLCKHFGHDAMGSDVCRLEVEAGRAMAEQAEALGVRVVPWVVQPMVPAPDFGRRFDLITGFQIKFDVMGDAHKTRWPVDAWRFFLSDLADNLLTEKGEIFLSGVRQCIPGTPAYDPGVVDFLRASGATVKKGTMHFSAPPKLAA